MASRPVWKGFIRFGLVSVPVRLYTAGVGESGKVRFNQLHKGCNQRVKYEKVCPTHGSLKTEEIVKGYEFAEDQYVIVDDAELEKLRTTKDKALDIVGFISPESIDALYDTERHYYITPDGPIAQKPYAVLHRAMADQKQHAFAQVVLNNREQIVRLRPRGRLIVADVLNYAERVKPSAEFEGEVVAVDISPQELQMARTLTEHLAVRDFKLAAYNDKYEERMAKLVESKVEGKEIVAAPEEEAAPQVINLMEALQRSVAEAKQAAGGAAARGLAAPGTADKAKAARKRKSS